MTRIAAAAVAAMLAIGVIVYLAWQWTAPSSRPDNPIAAATQIFQSINPEREFVDETVRPLLRSPLVRAAVRGADASGQPLDLQSHSNILILLASGNSIAPLPALNDALIAASGHFLDRYYDLGRREWRDDAMATGKPGAPTLASISRAILALALSYDATGNQRLLLAAQSAWNMHRAAYMAAALEDDARTDGAPLSMEVDSADLLAGFEAMLALYDVTAGTALWQDIELMARFLARDLLDHNDGLLAAGYGRDLKPDAGRPLVIADQFALAAALATAAQSGLSSLLVTPGSDLLDILAVRDMGELQGAAAVAAHIEGARAYAVYAAQNDRRDLWPAFARYYADLRRDQAALSPSDHDAQARLARFYLHYATVTAPDM